MQMLEAESWKLEAAEGAHPAPVYVPASTYRLQIHRGFPLTSARDIVPYLARLGVDACYTSPYFTAAPESTHGYDICNHNEISPELGGAAAHDAFASALAAHRMRHIVDFVPNHMGVGTGRNSWWNDVLENGPSSPAAMFFDIDWRPVKTELTAKLLLPILGDQYGRVLERGELQLAFNAGTLGLKYVDQELPLNPREAARVYSRAADRLKSLTDGESPALNEFLSIVSSLQNLPPYTTTDPARVAERQREKEVARTRLERLVSEQPAIREAIDAAIALFNGIPGEGGSFDALHELLEAQAYRLSYWRTASHEINYRRFFDVNTLAGLRIEHEHVFETTHQLLAQLIREGKVHAVRIDHPDGLFDPAKYFTMLQRLAARSLGLEAEEKDDGAISRPLYVVAEKILSGGELLPSRWAIHGTTGYSFLNDLNGVFVDSSQARRMRRVYAKLTGHTEAFDDVVYASKRLIMGTAMASELNVLAHSLNRISEGNRKSRDFTLDSLRDVITEFVACFPVYRTYVDASGWSAADRAVVARAISRARRRNPAMESSLFDFFREVVLPRDFNEGEPPSGPERRVGYPPIDEEEARERLRFSMKLQQYTGPVQAKGLEDTAFYRFNVLLSANEVGGDPARLGRTVQEFHESNAFRADHWPFEMLATSTHDTKLGEDVRMRINVLSEIPDEWGREASKWMRIVKAAAVNRRWRAGARSSGRVPLLPGARRCVAGRRARRRPGRARRSRGPIVGLHDQVREGSQGPYELADAERTIRARASAVRGASADGSVRGEAAVGRPALPAPRRGNRHDQLAGAGRAQDRFPRCAGLLSRDGVLGPHPGRSRQPPANRLREAGARARRRGCRARARTGTAGPSDHGLDAHVEGRPDQAAGDRCGASAPATAARRISRRRVPASSNGSPRSG